MNIRNHIIFFALASLCTAHSVHAQKSPYKIFSEQQNRDSTNIGFINIGFIIENNTPEPLTITFLMQNDAAIPLTKSYKIAPEKIERIWFFNLQNKSEKSFAEEEPYTISVVVRNQTKSTEHSELMFKKIKQGTVLILTINDRFANKNTRHTTRNTTDAIRKDKATYEAQPFLLPIQPHRPENLIPLPNPPATIEQREHAEAMPKSPASSSPEKTMPSKNSSRLQSMKPEVMDPELQFKELLSEWNTKQEVLSVSASSEKSSLKTSFSSSHESSPERISPEKLPSSPASLDTQSPPPLLPRQRQNSSSSPQNMPLQEETKQKIQRKMNQKGSWRTPEGQYGTLKHPETEARKSFYNELDDGNIYNELQPTQEKPFTFKEKAEWGNEEEA